jgi:hypothetical protein
VPESCVVGVPWSVVMSPLEIPEASCGDPRGAAPERAPLEVAHWPVRDASGAFVGGMRQQDIEDNKYLASILRTIQAAQLAHDHLSVKRPAGLQAFKPSGRLPVRSTCPRHSRRAQFVHGAGLTNAESVQPEV